MEAFKSTITGLKLDFQKAREKYVNNILLWQKNHIESYGTSKNYCQRGI